MIVENLEFKDWNHAYNMFQSNFKSVDRLKSTIKKYMDDNNVDECSLYIDVIGRYDAILNKERMGRRMNFDRSML